MHPKADLQADFYTEEADYQFDKAKSDQWTAPETHRNTVQTIKLASHTDARMKSFEEVRAEILEILIETKRTAVTKRLISEELQKADIKTEYPLSFN